MNRTAWFLAMVGFLIVAGGCAKRIASTSLTFESHERVVLTLKSGEEIQGKFAPGKRVEIHGPSGVQSAIVQEVSEESIVLADLNVIRDAKGVRMQAKRIGDMRYVVTDAPAERTIPRDDILLVEQVRLDAMETTRISTFLTQVAIVVALLMGERS